MNAPEVLERLNKAGLQLRVKGGNIVASPKSAATPELVELIREHKPELLNTLEMQRAVEMLNEHPGDIRAIYAMAQLNGRYLIEVAILNPDGDIESCLLDAQIDPFELLELIEHHMTIH